MIWIIFAGRLQSKLILGLRGQPYELVASGLFSTTGCSLRVLSKLHLKVFPRSLRRCRGILYQGSHNGLMTFLFQRVRGVIHFALVRAGIDPSPKCCFFFSLSEDFL